MDELYDQLRAAVAQAPPTRIDVDELIVADRRRRQHRAWALTGSGVAVAVIALTSTVVTGPYRDSREPTANTGPSLCAPLHASPSESASPFERYGSAPPFPSEQPADAAVRLTVALRTALSVNLPRELTVDSGVPGCPLPQLSYERTVTGDEYTVTVKLSRDEVRGDLVIAMKPTLGAVLGCPLGPSDNDCSIDHFPDGSEAVSGTDVDSAGAGSRAATVLRPDGTSVTVKLVQPGASVDDLLLTEDQLVTIGRWPGFNLYP
ncbi:hypothetical protein [Micromonospora saelicesensis]|uniref:hypothetical protein n=1 Tax=Micromonospora saelicesensis TaxID=285676 RepID=UPI000DC361B1|nr:hypothetical protein [Micromonospora saelicesensis]RAO57615.1 hypothetical protein PSN01_03079 [Micromonospora saelicesensis]